MPRESARQQRWIDRRQLLRAAGLAGLGLIAGCSESDDDPENTETTVDDGDDDGPTVVQAGTDRPGTRTEVQDDLEHVDQEFRMPTDESPDDAHWFYVDTWGFSDYELFTYEHGVWGQWNIESYHGIGDLNYQQYEEVVTEDDRIEITVRDDAYWSNGDPVLGRDAIVGPIRQRIHGGAMTFEAVEEEGPSLAWDAITDFDFDGKEATLYSDGGYFGDILDQNIWYRLLLSLGPRYNTRIHRYELYADRLFEIMEMAANGEIDPFDAPDEPTLRNEIQDNIFGSDTSQWHEYYQDPENVITNGAWTLDEFRGDQEIVLAPNEHHRNYDEINFDQVVLELQTAGDAVWTSLEANRYDFASAEPPEHVMNSLPSTYEPHIVPSGGGMSLETNHAHEWFGDVRFRQALYAALDKEELVEVSDPHINEPVTVPGGDVFGAGYIDDDWIDENLMDYAYDPELAAELLEIGGYVRDSNGMWVDENGDTTDVTLYTTTTSPELEPLVEQQLQEFGIDLGYQTMEGAIYQDAQDRGDLSCWVGSAGTGFAYGAARVYEDSWLYQENMRARNWFDGPLEENLEATEYDDNNLAVEQEASALGHLTVSVPPIGDFYAGPDEWEPVEAMALGRLHNRPPEELEDVYPQLLWCLNWHLPALPISNSYSPYFLNTANWHWPVGHEAWDYVGISSRLSHMDYHSWGDQIYANPDNPK